jgi:hypothetical protein
MMAADTGQAQCPDTRGSSARPAGVVLSIAGIDFSSGGWVALYAVVLVIGFVSGTASTCPDV